MTKYIFVTGGVVSGIGKGISAASIGRLLKDNGYDVFMQKFDPYLNIDPGTLSPYQHGEVFVTKDGGETDLDLGHYERFIDTELTRNSSVSSGKIYASVIEKERRGYYGGNTVQVIPHVTNEIKSKVYLAAKESNADIVITEIGGTVGDIESQPFLEAIRQIHSENDRSDVLFIHTTLVPTIPGSNELKTKPTQHSFKELMSSGIKANVFILRADQIISDDIKEKRSLFCDIPKEAIIQSHTVDLIYEVPIRFKEQGLDKYIMKKLNLAPLKDLSDNWKNMVGKFKNAKKHIKLAIVGKYIQLEDSYLSLSQALMDAGFNLNTVVDISFLDSEKINEENVREQLKDFDGILIPSGFGERGIEGMIETARYARENNVPYLGVSLGLQISAIEFARNVLGLKDANSVEFDSECKSPVVIRLQEINEKLGQYESKLKEGTVAYDAYKKEIIGERHRHSYILNREYIKEFEKNGMKISASDIDSNDVDIIEYKNNDFYVACQFNPEFISRPNRPHPLLTRFIESILGK